MFYHALSLLISLDPSDFVWDYSERTSKWSFVDSQRGSEKKRQVWALLSEAAHHGMKHFFVLFGLFAHDLPNDSQLDLVIQGELLHGYSIANALEKPGPMLKWRQSSNWDQCRDQNGALHLLKPPLKEGLHSIEQKDKLLNHSQTEACIGHLGMLDQLCTGPQDIGHFEILTTLQSNLRHFNQSREQVCLKDLTAGLQDLFPLTSPVDVPWSIFEGLGWLGA